MTAIITWRLTVKAADRVTHTLLVQHELTKWLSAAQDVEAGQLGYLLGGDPKFLRPYQSGKEAIERSRIKLEHLVADNPDQLAAVDAINRTMKARLAEIDQDIQTFLKDSKGAAAQLAESSADTDFGFMSHLRDQIMAAKQQERTLLDRRVGQFEMQSSWLLAAMLATLLACAALAFVALIRERQRVAALEITALTLTTTNRSLEKRVEVRTHELEIERDRAEAERERAEALLRDVTHRIGNTLSLVVGFINLHIRHTSDPKSLKTLTGARDRIHAIASAQRRMNVVNDLELVRIDTLIQAVLDDVVETVGEDRIELNVDVPPLLASAQVATSLCVLTQEFVVNSFKHAFADDDTGRVSVRLIKIGKTAAILIVEDDGRGYEDNSISNTAAGGEASKDGSSAHPSEGLGTKIAALLTRQFAGTISYENVHSDARRPGTRVTIELTELALSDPDESDASASVSENQTSPPA